MEITEDQIRTAAREVYDEVDSKFTYQDVVPQWRRGYSACLYTKDVEGQPLTPGCIVGRILAKCGVPLDMMHTCEGGIYSLYNHLKDQGIILPEAVREALTTAQVIQDAGRPWHEALTESRLVVTPEVPAV
jgi:hypothetical protein